MVWYNRTYRGIPYNTLCQITDFDVGKGSSRPWREANVRRSGYEIRLTLTTENLYSKYHYFSCEMILARVDSLGIEFMTNQLDFFFGRRRGFDQLVPNPEIPSSCRLDRIFRHTRMY